MTKSQNTKNEQQKDLCITSEQLTEQWKKGELPSGCYYVRLIRGEHRIDLYINDKNEWIDCPDNIIDTVVCKVPSYEEWQASENYIDYLKQCISVYESKDKQATETSIAYNELLEENTMLKTKNKELKKLLSKLFTTADISFCDDDFLQKIMNILYKNGDDK